MFAAGQQTKRTQFLTGRLAHDLKSGFQRVVTFHHHKVRLTATKQMRNYGGMVSFIPSGGVEAAHKIVTSTKLFTLAESLGAVESLIEVPAGMTHGSTAGSPLEVNPALVRLSVGIENIEDILEDLTQALS